MNNLSKSHLGLLLAGILLVTTLISAQESSDSAFTVHVVQRGENLFRIALLYDLFAEDLAVANGITDSNSLAIGQRLIIPLAADPSQLQVTHVVSAGETLASIAAAYETTIDNLMTLNSLASADLIYVGQELIIEARSAEIEPTPTPTAPPVTETEVVSAPAQNPRVRHSFSRFGDPVESFVHTVRSGETLFEIGLRYNQTVAALVQANNILDPGLLSVGQRLIIPGIQLPRLAQDLPPIVDAFTIDPLVFEAGSTGRIELLTNLTATVSGQFLGQDLRVIEREGGRRHNILVGIAMFTEMDVYPLSLVIQDDSGESTSIAANLQVISGGYGSQTIAIDDSELLSPAVEEEEIALLVRLTDNFTPERSWTNSLSLPAAASMNALFGTLRSYNGSPFDRYHRGVDFAGAPGTPVLAAADGTVRMADRLNLRGNTVLIDHGWGLHTLYAHQQEITVELGESVTTGQVIGAVGSTGRSTGPHLHWEVWLNGVNIDPLQWVQEVFP